MRTRLSAVRGLVAIVLCLLLVEVEASGNGAFASTLRADSNQAATTTSVLSTPQASQASTTTSTTSPSTTTSTANTLPAVTVPATTLPSSTTTTASTTSTTVETTTTTLDPQTLANLIQGLDSAVAEAQAVNQYIAAKALAAQIPSGQPLPGGTDPVLVQAAQAQLQANADQQAANQRFAEAERGIGQVATDLYVDGNAVAGASSPLADTADRSAFLTGVLDAEETKAKQAKQQLVQASAAIAQSRARADQLVATRTAELQALAVQAAAAAQRATPTTTATVPQQGGTGSPGAAALAGVTPATIPSLLAEESPSVLGPSLLTADEIAGWYQAQARQPNLTVPLSQLASDFETVGSEAGVRGDIAFAQSIVETDYFDFPSWGQVTVSANNFAGIGACDSCAHGYTFHDALTGVEAQMQLLHAYATTSQPFPGPLPGPFYVAGCCQTWMALSGVWATNVAYGIEILTVYRSMVLWALAQRRAAAKL
ncbi:MAG: glucosaminidase domain-containing protein [Acidimicrobiales bacterium]